MRKLIILSLMSFVCCTALAQFTYKIKADSVRITNDSCSAELILENSTKHVLGFLYNRGNGRTEFRTGSSIGDFILNQYSSDQPASFRISGRGLIKGGFSSTLPYGIGNERMGDSALASLTTASDKNIAIGYKALKKWNQPYGNMIAIGAHALENLDTAIDIWGDQPSSIAIGVNAMKNHKISTHGMWDDNVAIGYNALRGSDTATTPIGGYAVNVGIGAHALENITTGNQNVYVGGYSGTQNTSGHNNVIVGSWTGSITTGSLNIGMGTFALGGIVTGNENIGLGHQVFGESSADRNGSIGIGYQIGRYGAGDSSIYIGSWLGWYEAHHNEFLLSHYGKTLLLGEFNGRKALKPQGAMIYVTETASDANYTANATAYYIMLPSITASRTLTIPSASSNLGRQIKIFNKNSSGNTWSFTTAIKKPDGTSVTNLTNQSCLFLFSDGTDWIDVLAGGGGGGSGSGWLPTGNNLATTGIFGSLNNFDVDIKRNNLTYFSLKQGGFNNLQKWINFPLNSTLGNVPAAGGNSYFISPGTYVGNPFVDHVIDSSAFRIGTFGLYGNKDGFLIMRPNTEGSTRTDDYAIVEAETYAGLRLGTYQSADGVAIDIERTNRVWFRADSNLFQKKLSYAGNIHSTFNQFSLVTKKYVDSVAAGGGSGRVMLASDVTNNNGTANTIANVTGLSIAVTAGVTYKFKFYIVYTAAATTTGSRWSIDGPSTTFLHYTSEYSLSTTSKTTNQGISAYNSPSGANNSSAATTSNVAIIEGVIKPSANGTVIARFASEVANSAIVAKGGMSYVEFEVIN